MASEISSLEIDALVNQTAALGWIDTPPPLFSDSVSTEDENPSSLWWERFYLPILYLK
jgi:hypothetical protein